MPDLYQLMLMDEPRIRCYERAIHAVVRPGDVVADIGSAMGTFSLFAAQAGARHVYGIEVERIVDVARETALRAGLADRVTFIEGYSTDVDLPEQADVVLYEDFTSLLLHASVGEILRDARARFLKPHGKLIPRSATLSMAPFEDAALYREVDAWGDDASCLYGFDFSAMREMAVNSITYHGFDPDDLLSEPQRAASYDFLTEQTFDLSTHRRFTTRRDGTLHGIAVWFDSELAPGVVLNNAPGCPTTIWHQGVFPVEHPMPVHAGDFVDVTLQTVRSRAFGFFWNWTVSIADP